MHFKKMKSLLCLPAIALCATLSMGSASAHDANISRNIPASDTSVASIGMISSNEQVAIGLVRTTEEMVRAREELAERKEAIEAAKIAEEQAAIQAANPYTPNYQRIVAYSPAHTANQSITANGIDLGKFKITFYCACEQCSGGYGNNTATGTKCTEGRTIAVDPSVIPLGSEVFIEGFGSFVAEDTGGAIKQNKIDIYLSDHDRCYSLGVANANVYLMNK